MSVRLGNWPLITGGEHEYFSELNEAGIIAELKKKKQVSITKMSIFTLLSGLLTTTKVLALKTILPQSFSNAIVPILYEYI